MVVMLVVVVVFFSSNVLLKVLVLGGDGISDLGVAGG